MPLIGEFAALGTALCWAFGSNFFMAAGRRIGSLTLNRLRLSAGVIFLCSTLWLTQGSPWPVDATSRQILILSASGLIGFVFGDSFYFRALVILGAGRATLLAASAPIFTAILARMFLGETLGIQALVGIALSLSGLAWTLYGHARTEHVSPEGSVAVGLISGGLAALGQGGGFVLSKVAMESGIEPLPATVIRITAAVVGMWLLAPLQGGFRRPIVALRDRVAARAMLGGAFFGPFLGVTLSLTALVHTKAAIAASIMACYPIPAVLIATRVHREALTVRFMLGAVVTIAGIVTLFLR
jgi:drug/metabolite transporter (DMT)-like permease